MNSLAAEPNGILVPQDLLDTTGLQLGDVVEISTNVGLLNQGFRKDMKIVGAYTYFPTVYPADTPTLIISLGTLFSNEEAATGYDVWLNIQENARVDSVIEMLQKMALSDQMQVDIRKNTLEQIQTQIGQPEWVGLFGILSVGFLLTGLMPCIAFVLDTFASLRKHFVQLGILMAVGFSGPMWPVR